MFTGVSVRTSIDPVGAANAGGMSRVSAVCSRTRSGMRLLRTRCEITK
ncbi:hypothetical protein BJ956_000655 [Arthrobacter psychrochitiniphilus]|nr:hypothetical protein [Arthrobacter psychrochitiniphilus]